MELEGPRPEHAPATTVPGDEKRKDAKVQARPALYSLPTETCTHGSCELSRRREDAAAGEEHVGEANALKTPEPVKVSTSDRGQVAKRAGGLVGQARGVRRKETNGGKSCAQ